MLISWINSYFYSLKSAFMKIAGFFTFLLLLTCWSPCLYCQPEKENLRIALSQASPNYTRWLHRADSTIVCLDLFLLSPDSAVKILATCRGLVLTGGGDFDPAYYCRVSDTGRCEEIDPRRDHLEMQLIQKSLSMGMPIIGICRGMQILNVHEGGSLFIDLPTDFGTTVTHRCEDYLHCFHNVNIDVYSFLQQIVKVDSGQVASNHHQGIRHLAWSLKAVAFANDGLTEAVEWNIRSGRQSFMEAVQWHPERMEADNPLSQGLLISFIHAVHDFQSNIK